MTWYSDDQVQWYSWQLEDLFLKSFWTHWPTNHFKLEVFAKGIETCFFPLTSFLIYIRKRRSRWEKDASYYVIKKKLFETGTEQRNYDLGALGSYTRIPTDISFPVRAACQKFVTLCFHLTIDLLRGKVQGTENSSIFRRLSKHFFNIFIQYTESYILDVFGVIWNFREGSLISLVWFSITKQC